MIQCVKTNSSPCGFAAMFNNQQGKRGKIMSLIKVGIIIEIFLFVGVFLWIRKLRSKKVRQPSLSKKILKNLKF